MTTPALVLRRRPLPSVRPALAMSVLVGGLLLSLAGYAALALLLVQAVLGLL